MPLVFSRLRASAARGRPTLLAGKRVERRRAPVRHRLFASPQNDRVVIKRWRGTVRLAGIPDHREDVLTSRLEPERASPLERRDRVGRGCLLAIFIRAGQTDAKNRGLVTGPAGSFVAVRRQLLDQNITRAAPTFFAGLLPEW